MWNKIFYLLLCLPSTCSVLYWNKMESSCGCMWVNWIVNQGPKLRRELNCLSSPITFFSYIWCIFSDFCYVSCLIYCHSNIPYFCDIIWRTMFQIFHLVKVKIYNQNQRWYYLLIVNCFRFYIGAIVLLKLHVGLPQSSFVSLQCLLHNFAGGRQCVTWNITPNGGSLTKSTFSVHLK